MPWYYCVLEFVSGLPLANGVPHFVQDVSGHRFQSPFASPHGVGESSPLVNALWGFANLALRFILLWLFRPQAPEAAVGWILIGSGVMLAAVLPSIHFGRVRTTTLKNIRGATAVPNRPARRRAAPPSPNSLDGWFEETFVHRT
jgi:hypothetical protein